MEVWMIVSLVNRIKNRVAWEFFRLRKPPRVLVSGKRMVPNYKTYHKHTLRGLANGWHEACEIKQLERLIDEGRIVPGKRAMDVGAGLGLVTMKIADVVGDENVIGYEADPCTAVDCRKNLAENGHAVEIINAAITAGHHEQVTFQVADSLCGSSLLPTPKTVREELVPARNFKTEIDHVDPQIILMDVEGAESDLLQSITDFRSVELILVEIHPAIAGDVGINSMIEHLLNLGFSATQTEFAHVVVFTRDIVPPRVVQVC